jgi:hypothetical protein
MLFSQFIDSTKSKRISFSHPLCKKFLKIKFRKKCESKTNFNDNATINTFYTIDVYREKKKFIFIFFRIKNYKNQEYMAVCIFDNNKMQKDILIGYYPFKSCNKLDTICRLTPSFKEKNHRKMLNEGNSLKINISYYNDNHCLTIINGTGKGRQHSSTPLKVEDWKINNEGKFVCHNSQPLSVSH